jgi:hypothetical protein
VNIWKENINKKLCFLLFFPAAIPNLAPLIFKTNKKPEPILKSEQKYPQQIPFFKEFEHPHPEKIIWCLQNPTNSDINIEMTSCFKNNIVASLFLLNAVVDIFKTVILNFGNTRN